MPGTATYMVTQADINAGTVHNLATADSTESEEATDTEDVTLPQNAALSVVKTGTFDAGADGFADVGEVISYEFLVTNEGNVTLTGITVTDPLPGLSAIALPKTTLAVGESMTGTATYMVTQADINAGTVHNLATADSTESEEATDTEDVTLPQNAALSVVKTGTFDAGADGFADVGEVISYEFLLTNEGNVTLTGITVTDPLPNLSAIALTK